MRDRDACSRVRPWWRHADGSRRERTPKAVSAQSSAHTEHRLYGSSVVEGRGPRPAAMRIDPHHLQRRHLVAEHCSREYQVHVGVLHLDHFDERAGGKGDPHAGYRPLAIHGSPAESVQRPRRTPRWEACCQKFGQPVAGQADRVSEWHPIALDVLHRPATLEHGLAQFGEVLLCGAIRVVALPAHRRSPFVVLAATMHAGSDILWATTAAARPAPNGTRCERTELRSADALCRRNPARARTS
jgi:hypothetical protein